MIAVMLKCLKKTIKHQSTLKVYVCKYMYVRIIQKICCNKSKQTYSACGYSTFTECASETEKINTTIIKIRIV